MESLVVGFFKNIMDASNKMEVIVNVLNLIPGNVRITQVICNLKPIHIKMAFASCALKYMLKDFSLFRGIMKNHLYWENAYNDLKKVYLEDSVKMFVSTDELAANDENIAKKSLNDTMDVNRLSQIINSKQMSEKEKNDARQLIFIRLGEVCGFRDVDPNVSGKTPLPVDDDWMDPTTYKDPNDVIWSKEEREELLEQESKKLANLERRYKNMMEFIEGFYESFQDEEVRDLIKTSNVRVFTDDSIVKKIDLFSAEKFKEIKDPKKPVFSHIAQFWVSLKSVDDYNVKQFLTKFPKSSPSEVPKNTEILWSNLNNLILLSQLMINVKDEQLAEFLSFLTTVYLDFRAEKYENFGEIYKIMIGKLDELFPDQTTTGTSEDIFSFLLQAMYVNFQFFRQIVTYCSLLIPDGITNTMKEHGYDLEKIDLNQLMENHGHKILQVKEKLSRRETTLTKLLLRPSEVVGGKSNDPTKQEQPKEKLNPQDFFHKMIEHSRK